MSLINDALKRAKAAQKKDEPATAAPLQFRPVEPGQQPRRRLPWPMFIGLGALLLSGIFLLKVFTRIEPLKVEAKPVQQESLVANQISSPAPAASKVLPPGPQPATLQAKTQDVAVAASPVPVEPPKPVVPRLQGVLYNPAHPSAVINGKSVFVGEKFAQFRVTAITRDSATLVSATETKVLKFEE